MIFLYKNDCTDPAFNLALEELLASESENDCFMLWRNAPSIIIGRHQNTAAEINAEFVRDKEIRVVRRITGGGAVYHDPGNINYSFISMERSWGPESAERYTAPIINALHQIGINAVFSGRNDILANGCKVSGCARSVVRDRTLFHGTLLFDTDLSVLTDALNPDPEKIHSKGIKSVRARVGNLRDMLPPEHRSMDMNAFIRHLYESLPPYFMCTGFSPLPETIQQKAANLADSKYRTWDWNYGTSIVYDMEKKLRFAGGGIQVQMNIQDNRIAALRFSGDFFGSRPIEELVEKLSGQPPRLSSLLPLLSELNLSLYIAGIEAEELAGLLSLSD